MISKKVESAIDHICRSHLEIDGGWPFDWVIVDGILIVAGVGHKGEPQLMFFRVDDLERCKSEDDYWGCELTEDEAFEM